MQGDKLQCLMQVCILALLALKEGLTDPHAAPIMPHKPQYISESMVNVGHVPLITMQASNHYSSAHSASLHRQAGADGLFGVVFFFFPLFYSFFKLDLLIPPGNLCWILFIITFFLFCFVLFCTKSAAGR